MYIMIYINLIIKWSHLQHRIHTYIRNRKMADIYRAAEAGNLKMLYKWLKNGTSPDSFLKALSFACNSSRPTDLAGTVADLLTS